ncbi:MAG: cellulase family glycosylhydrolase [Chloroflexales bacterium]|nr:cellulase family glycosylhydrolase [Chloroflexales bacterium]
MKRLLSLVCCLALLVALASGCAAGQPDNPKYALWQRPGALRGLNQSTPTMVDVFKPLGINLVQFSTPGIWQRQPPYTQNDDVLALLDQMVKAASDQQIYCVIAMRSGPGLEDVYEAGLHKDVRTTIWGSPAEIKKYGEMWALIAARYKDNPRVIGYNLLVEPTADRWAGAEGGTPEEGQRAMEQKGIDWQAIASGWAKQIRAADPLTPIIVGAQSWATPTFFRILKPIDDPFAVYDVHQYEPHAYTHQLSQGDDPAIVPYPGTSLHYWRLDKAMPFDQSFLPAVLQDVRDFQQRNGNPPIFVGEYGAEYKYAPGSDQFIADQTALFAQYGWHSAVWYSSGPFSFIDQPAVLDVLKNYWKGGGAS